MFICKFRERKKITHRTRALCAQTDGTKDCSKFHFIVIHYHCVFKPAKIPNKRTYSCVCCVNTSHWISGGAVCTAQHTTYTRVASIFLTHKCGRIWDILFIFLWSSVRPPACPRSLACLLVSPEHLISTNVTHHVYGVISFNWNLPTIFYLLFLLIFDK